MDQQDTFENAVPVKCGCGRNPNGYCNGLHKLSTDDFVKWLQENQPKETD